MFRWALGGAQTSIPMSRSPAFLRLFPLRLWHELNAWRCDRVAEEDDADGFEDFLQRSMCAGSSFRGQKMKS